MSILILHLSKLRPWEGKGTSQGNTASEQRCWASKPKFHLQRSDIRMLRISSPACKDQPQPHLLSKMGPIFCRDLATLKRTLATGSPAIRSTVGSMCLVVMSCPQTSDSTWESVSGTGVIIQRSRLTPIYHFSSSATLVITRSEGKANQIWGFSPRSPTVGTVYASEVPIFPNTLLMSQSPCFGNAQPRPPNSLTSDFP